MKGAVLFGIAAGWIAAGPGRDREIEVLSLFVFGPMMLHAQFLEERPRPLWATQLLYAGGSAALTYRLLGMVR